MFRTLSRSCLPALCALAVVLTGCASAPANTPDNASASSVVVHPGDPWEQTNRAIFRFNQNLDEAVLLPLAKGYKAITPQPVRIAVRNWFNNLDDLWIGFNSMLQGKFANGVNDWARFIFNSTLGLGGLIDIASPGGMPKHDEDFGQTLAVWGVGEGPFVMLPLFGPSTLRDAGALPVDLAASPLWFVDDTWPLTILHFVHARSELIGTEDLLRQATFDEYAYMRDFYLQQRRYKVSDGQATQSYDDLYDELND